MKKWQRLALGAGTIGLMALSIAAKGDKSAAYRLGYAFVIAVKKILGML